MSDQGFSTKITVDSIFSGINKEASVSKLVNTNLTEDEINAQEDVREARKNAMEGDDAQFYADLKGDANVMAMPGYDTMVDAVVITDGTLQAVVDIRTRLKEAKALVKDLEAQETVMAGEVMALLREKTPCVGKMQAFIDQKDGRSTPAWKDEFINHMMADHKSIKKEIEAAMKLKYPAKASDILVIAGTTNEE